MAGKFIELERSPETLAVVAPDLSHLITEDDTPVDNLFSEMQQRLLVEPLNSSWAGGPERRKFLAAANVGIFSRTQNPPVVPDMFLSLDVERPDDLWTKENRSYLIWIYGKPPEVVIEIVSNLEGGEATKKLGIYARMKVRYYAIFDPELLLSDELLRVYELQKDRYIAKTNTKLDVIGLGLTQWKGVFEKKSATWLRWTDTAGNLLLTGEEGREQEYERAERFAARLRALGIDPELNE